MYLWRIENLKSDLTEEIVSEKDLFFYVLISTIAYAIVTEALIWIPSEEMNVWDQLSSIGNILIVSIGTFFCFKANGAADGKDFLKKYISISFVMTIRYLVWLMLLFVPMLGFYFYTNTEDSDLASTAFDTIPFLMLFVFYYWRVYFHISDLNTHNKSSNLDAASSASS